MWLPTMRWQVHMFFPTTGRKMHKIPPWCIIPQNHNIPQKGSICHDNRVAYRPFIVSWCLLNGWYYLKSVFLIEKYGTKAFLNRKKWLSLQKNKRLIEKYGTFSRHGRIKASFILLIWLNENVRHTAWLSSALRQHPRHRCCSVSALIHRWSWWFLPPYLFFPYICLEPIMLLCENTDFIHFFCRIE